MENQLKAKKYQRLKLILSVSEAILSFVLLLIFVLGGYAQLLRDYVLVFHLNVYGHLLLFLAIIGVAFSFFSLPFSFTQSFWLEHFFGLSNQHFLKWIWERLKMTFVGLILIIPVVLLFYFFLRTFPESWWFWTATALFVFSIGIGKIAPQIIFPLFYKFEPVSDEDLLARLQGLAKAGKFSLEGVYRFNMSKSTKKANAAFTGLGKSRRIIFGDTLLEDFSLDEIETVFAHEVGHYVHGHLLKGIARSTLATYLTLFLAAQAYQFLIFKLGLNGVADLAALPLLSIIFSLFGLISEPFNNFLSRKDERQADAFALRNSSNPKAFIDTMNKLSISNLSDKAPVAWVEFLFHSHPSINSRIAQARRFLETENEKSD